MKPRTQHQMTPAMYRELRPQFAVSSAGAVLVGVAYFLLPERLIVGPNWLPLAVVGIVLVPLAVALMVWDQPHHIHRFARIVRLVLQSLLTLSLLVSLVLYVAALPDLTSGGGRILRPAALLWVSNILIFASWYWELDGDGPVKRRMRGHSIGDFLFPQATAEVPFVPGFVDYLFLAFCFATALSPADTAPLTHRAKLLMMMQALISLTILVLLVARSVNIF